MGPKLIDWRRAVAALINYAVTLLITGGAGFIGSAVVRAAIGSTDERVVNFDALTYAGNPATVASVANHARYTFVHADIRDRRAVASALATYQPSAIVHLAAESHVDRSIDGPADVLDTNVHGTFVMLEEARRFWMGLPAARRASFRFVHVSTDEVFGSLGADGRFGIESPYRPTSPYAASKAAADHLVRAWHNTYELPTVVTNCTNNYGPFQYPEKLIPVIIANAVAGRSLPVYGKGENVRDWLYVDDHAAALLLAARRGMPGATYLVGARNEIANIDLVRRICALVDALRPNLALGHRETLIEFVTDRPGHDLRYAIDPSSSERELGWRPRTPFAEGLRATVEWYLAHPEWSDRAGGLGERRGLALHR
jgi:dTDP-glucose 4,6-dehydratase